MRLPGGGDHACDRALDATDLRRSSHHVDSERSPVTCCRPLCAAAVQRQHCLGNPPVLEARRRSGRLLCSTEPHLQGGVSAHTLSLARGEDRVAVHPDVGVLFQSREESGGRLNGDIADRRGQAPQM